MIVCWNFLGFSSVKVSWASIFVMMSERFVCNDFLVLRQLLGLVRYVQQSVPFTTVGSACVLSTNVPVRAFRSVRTDLVFAAISTARMFVIVRHANYTCDKNVTLNVTVLLSKLRMNNKFVCKCVFLLGF
jgi:hypothetical protein